MPEITINVDVECVCGNTLSATADKYGAGLVIEPCDKCLERERADGHTEGYAEAEKDLAE